MSDDKEIDQSNKIQETNASIENSRTIFTYEEIQNMVKSFIKAWATGKIKINFPSRSELINWESQKGKVLDVSQAFEEERKWVSQFTDVVEICCGAKDSTESELKKGTFTLFKTILHYRGSHRIDGSFMDYTLEKKVDNLEKMVDANTTVVEQLIKWVTEEASGNEFRM